jgi:hypothetical protein
MHAPVGRRFSPLGDPNQATFGWPAALHKSQGRASEPLARYSAKPAYEGDGICQLARVVVVMAQRECEPHFILPGRKAAITMAPFRASYFRVSVAQGVKLQPPILPNPIPTT